MFRILAKKPVQKVSLDTSGTNIATNAWATILPKASNLVGSAACEVINTTGKIVKLAIGDAGSEVELNYLVPPGGTDGLVPLEVPKGVRVSAQAVDATASTGFFCLNLFG